MASKEVLVAQLGAQSFDERGEVIGDVARNRLQPQVNGGANKQVQPKAFIISMLRIIQCQWRSGQAAGVRISGGNQAAPESRTGQLPRSPTTFSHPAGNIRLVIGNRVVAAFALVAEAA